MVIISNDKPIKKHNPPPDREINGTDVLLESFSLSHAYKLTHLFPMRSFSTP